MPEENKITADARFYAFRNAACFDRGEAALLLAQDPTLIEVRNSIGETALHFLIVENDFTAMEWLLERGADINTRNDFTNTPLMEAARLGYLKMCEYLLSRGADLGARTDDGETAISGAAQSGKQEVLEMLLSRLPEDADINDYFDNLSPDMILDNDNAIASLLSARGLKRRW